MTSFEFVFSLYGLLLGLALAEVLGGLAKALKVRRRGGHMGLRITRLGLAMPLLATFLAIDIGDSAFSPGERAISFHLSLRACSSALPSPNYIIW